MGQGDGKEKIRWDKKYKVIIICVPWRKFCVHSQNFCEKNVSGFAGKHKVSWKNAIPLGKNATVLHLNAEFFMEYQMFCEQTESFSGEHK